jgi:hypothetical protein
MSGTMTTGSASTSAIGTPRGSGAPNSLKFPLSSSNESAAISISSLTISSYDNNYDCNKNFASVLVLIRKDVFANMSQTM